MRRRLFFIGCSIVSLGLGSCGEEEAGFVACGGAVKGSWSITSATLSAAIDGCAIDAPVTGFMVFNDNGRVSVNLKAGSWIVRGDAECGQQKQFGAFWRANGSSLCMALAEADLDAACAGNPPSTDGWAGSGDYCVEGSTLKIRTSSLLGLTAEAIVTLGPMP
ncbi:MAG: hypothetical protein HYV07_22285 [Deltaproteobacteria bacterium]|nr:hypothetical protein [Deltaproteobacteria bacterium]